MNTEEQKNNEEEMKEPAVDIDNADIDAKKEEIDYLEGWKRCQADFQNYKREESKRMQDLIGYANANLMTDILEAIDIFDLADKFVPEEIVLKHKQWLDGFFYGVKQLEKQLEANGLEKIIADDVAFNPQEHEIVGEADDSSDGQDKKVKQIRAGYKLKGRVLRPARVTLN